MRASSRTYELFEIARLILGKLERCVVVYKRREVPGEPSTPLFVSVPDGLPFPSEEEAIAHALEHAMGQLFTTETVEVEPPKGAFQFVNRCPITKDLLGPPNYHRYSQILQNHYNTRGIHMPFERYKASIEVVRDEEAVKAWVESMKTATRYTFKEECPGEVTVFDSPDEARSFLLRVFRDRIVRTMDTVRVAAKVVEAAGQTEAARAMHGMLDAQRRFPLDTANALRGRLRRENFHIFKRGAKGVTYVCAVRRRFRQVGQVFSDSINQLIEFLEKHPLIGVGELAPQMLGITPPAAPETHAAHPAGSDAASAEAAAPEPVAELSPEQKTALNRLALDLRWLVAEGYVAEYSDGRLFAHPMMEPERAGQSEGSRDGAEDHHGTGEETPPVDHGDSISAIEAPIDAPAAKSDEVAAVGESPLEVAGSGEAATADAVVSASETASDSSSETKSPDEPVAGAEPTEAETEKKSGDA
ncbi:hypothetical protein [Congregicoccus parvus]|uniref:hypothetical protein n=1 Tax=Congregicoccus parvus TaxID=3081749 RepID=UPI003FA59561